MFFYFSSESAAARPKLKLLPRSVKDPVNAVASTERNAAIFGTGKPREKKEGEVEPSAEPRGSRNPSESDRYSGGGRSQKTSESSQH